jgi:predicted dehydrogenase
MGNISCAPKILVIGAGSIGKRHARNCAVLGAEVSIHDVVPSSLQTLCKETGYTAVQDLSAALKNESYDAALVCTPNHLHVPVALEVVDAGLDVFIEKPLSHTFEGVEELIKKINSNQIIAMGGFNLRFEPGLQYLKRSINLSDVAFAQIESGFYLPSWRPGTDYRKSYSANKSMGGGIILDDVHELDYACWLFGYPKSVQCSFGKFSDLEIDVEDTADFHFTYPDKTIIIHSDYLQKRYARSCKIGLRNGNTIEWKFGDSVTEYTGETKKVFSYKDSFDLNTLYLDELRVFFRHIKDRTLPESDILNAAKILKIALQAKQN